MPEVWEVLRGRVLTLKDLVLVDLGKVPSLPPVQASIFFFQQ